MFESRSLFRAAEEGYLEVVKCLVEEGKAGSTNMKLCELEADVFALAALEAISVQFLSGNMH